MEASQLFGETRLAKIDGADSITKVEEQNCDHRKIQLLAELAVGSVIAAAIAPAYYEWFERDRKEKSKHW